MSNKIVYIEGANSITVSLDGKVYPVGKAHAAYANVLEAIKEADFATLRTLLAPRAEMVRLSAGRLLLENGILTINGREVHDAITNRIMLMLKDGGNVEPVFLFLSKLDENPSFRARQEFWGFMEACKLPIAEDGDVFAYKLISHDYKDLRTGTMDNSIGAIVEMDRNMVDEDCNQTCSYGLHFASEEYIKNGGYSDEYGSRLVVVKINPRDVVSIPTDYKNSKGRACRYEIFEEVAHGTSIEVNAFGYGIQDVADEPEQDDAPVQDDPTDGDKPTLRAANVKISDATARKFLKALANQATLTSACAIANISRRDGARIRDREGRWATFQA